MGLLSSKVFNSLLEDKSIRILILGLDNSGKTSILYKLYQEKEIQMTPTMGFNVEILTYNNLKFKIWDVAGQSELRKFWTAYYKDTRGIIYVVDSSDKGRLKQSKEVLINVLKDEDLKNVPLLILANKQDMEGALSQTKLCEYLKLKEQKSRKWRIIKCSALTGQGLMESMEWMANTFGK